MNAVTSDQRTADVRAYIGAVRAWLADLPAEDVEELTFGMEADLDERAAEGDVRLGELLGQPEEYAAELRSAAGLPPRSATVEGASSPGWFSTMDAAATEAGARALEQWPWLGDLRPAWWLFRGALLGWVLDRVLGMAPATWLLIPVGAAVSFWWGRRGSGGPVSPSSLVLTRFLNVVAMLTAVWTLLVLAASSGAPAASDEYVPPGLVLDGGMVSNLYVYDAQGNRVEGARVFTDDGRGIFVDPTTIDPGPDGLPYRPDGSVDVATDVFPLRVGDRDPWTGTQGGWTPPLTMPALPAVPSPAPTEAASPAPSPSASPSASATSSPSPTATPTPAG